MKGISRRFVIEGGLASLGAAAFVFRRLPWLSIGLSSGPAIAGVHRRVCVSVHGPDGKHLQDPATVTLKPAGGGASIALTAEGTVLPVLYGSEVPEGDYDLTVEDIGALRATPCAITVVGEQVRCIGVFMYQQGTPCLFYRIGGSQIPFTFKPSVVGVLVPGQFANPRTAQEYENKLATHGLKPYRTVPSDPRSWTAARDFIWFFSFDLSTHAGPAEVARAREKAARVIRREFRRDLGREGISSDSIRIGAPTQLEPGNVKILETRYVVRLKKSSNWQSARGMIQLRGTNATVSRKLNLAPDTYLVEFSDHDHPRHLRLVETWLRSGMFLYIEPDLIVELQQHACSSPLPNDPVSTCQEGLARQCVSDAWGMLETHFGAGKKFGRPDICVGLIEGPADPTHADIDDSAIKHCELFNWDPSMSCYQQLDSGKQLTTQAKSDAGMVNHGTWVFGVGGAVTGNLKAVAGIAPTVTKVIAVPPSGVAITKYCETVLWLAGLGVPTGSSAPRLGAPGKPPAADVINCSHGVGSMPTPAQVCDAFARVTKEGRKGKGTVLVYSAGNNNDLIENAQAFADDPHVITVGATMLEETTTGVVEKRWISPTGRGSNYGHSLDLCAIGAEVPTLDTGQGVAYECGVTSHQNVSGLSGTSIAAPAVSAACALMLTANSDLKWCELRDVLRSSARRPVDSEDLNFQEEQSTWTNDRNPRFGSGRLDVFAAVQGAMNYASQSNEDCDVSCNYSALCAGTGSDCQ